MQRWPLHVDLASELRTGPLRAPHCLLSLTLTVKQDVQQPRLSPDGGSWPGTGQNWAMCAPRLHLPKKLA